ncbi:hypothetical protein [Persicirhabdus sediminis]|uniref:Uncharacterized protein n=1 Tax=Persicirhabdus sediminis TaxID=454144 RepID=A0A8J7SHV9_9BACT|nr:hypothetical protein [Persicirhabdus sediminis]MBK1791040.1 hypothetical protein [Persicirhabdus sediminis]
MADRLSTSQRRMNRAGEEYAREIVKALPELRDGGRTAAAREKYYAQLVKDKILSLTPLFEGKIEDGENCIDEKEYSDLLAVFTESDFIAGNQRLEFLVKYASGSNLKSEQQLLAYRLLKKDAGQLTKLKENRRKEVISAVALAYQSYVETSKEKPASLHDLQLADEHKVYADGQDWIYLGGDPKVLKFFGNVVCVIEPVATDGKRAVGFTNGKVSFYKEDYIVEQIEAYAKRVESSKASSTKKSPKQDAPADLMEVSNEQSNENVVVARSVSLDNWLADNELGLQAALAAYQEWSQLRNEAPDRLADMMLDENHRVCQRRKGRNADWLYLGGREAGAYLDSERVVYLSPFEVDGHRIAALASSEVVLISAEQAKELLTQIRLQAR